MSDDLISRQAAIDVLEERLRANGYSNVALVSELNRSIGYLKQLPSVQPEIIRCKDCKWWDQEADGSKIGYCHAIKHCYYTRNWEIQIHRKYEAEFYCADGERRTDEEDE